MSSFSFSSVQRPLRWVAAALTLSLVSGLAFSAPGGPHGGGMGGGMGGPMMMGGGQHIEHMLDAVNATADQRAQIKQITDAARADVKTVHQGGRALHEQMMQLFTQPTVDARAAEALRQQQLAIHDQVSKRMLQAMIDISRVLTPEQRQQLASRLAQRKSMMQRHQAERQMLDKPAGK